MNDDQDKKTQELDPVLQEIHQKIWTVAQNYQGDTQELLLLLRTLELIHRQIRTQFFEPNLPDTRQALYGLLRDIQESGGWPYIERMRLQDILRNWAESAEFSTTDCSES